MAFTTLRQGPEGLDLVGALSCQRPGNSLLATRCRGGWLLRKRPRRRSNKVRNWLKLPRVSRGLGTGLEVSTTAPIKGLWLITMTPLPQQALAAAYLALALPVAAFLILPKGAPRRVPTTTLTRWGLTPPRYLRGWLLRPLKARISPNQWWMR